MAEARFLPIGGSTLAGAAILHAIDGGVQLKVNFNGRGPGRVPRHDSRHRQLQFSQRIFGGAAVGAAGVPLAEEGYPILKKRRLGPRTSSGWRVYKLTGPDGVVGRSVVVHEGGAVLSSPDRMCRTIGSAVALSVRPVARCFDVLKLPVRRWNRRQ